MLYRVHNQEWTPIENWIKHGKRSYWFKIGPMSVYMRHSKRFNDEKWYSCIDVANVGMHPDYRGNGLFTDFMTGLETEPLNLYIEMVHNERLAAWFQRRKGYVRIGHDGDVPCFLRVNKSTGGRR